jgi:mRNA interferase ChpB
LKGWGLQTTGVVRCDQIRTADPSVRGARFIEQAPSALVQEVIARVQTIFGDAEETYASKPQ